MTIQTRNVICAAVFAAAGFAGNPAAANEEVASQVRDRVGAEYTLSWFERIRYSVGRNRVTVSAEGENVDLSQTYAFDGTTLGEVLEQDFSTSDDPEIVRGVLGDDVFATLLDGRSPSDISYDKSCDGADCDYSFDMSGPGFDVSFDGSCDASGCDFSSDEYDEALERALEEAEELAEAERERAEEQRERDQERAEDEADRAADRADDARDAAEDAAEAENDDD